MFTQAEVAKSIDHAVLKPSATQADLLEGITLCLVRRIGNLCVRPSDVVTAAAALRGSTCSVSTVIGFPHGSSVSDAKVLEARCALEQGAQELDMVMNIGQFLSGEYAGVEKDIVAVVNEAKPCGGLVKVILETCLLDPAQIAQACLLAEQAGADFVKTSTGFNGPGATKAAVAVMVETVSGRLGVKASGGIRTWEDAVGYLEMGCSRIGTGSSEAILTGAPS